MKKLLLVSSAIALATMTMGARTPEVRFVSFGKKHFTEARAKQRAEAKKALETVAAAQLWRPATITTYYWGDLPGDPMIPGWTGERATKYEYDINGNVTRYTTDGEICEYAYDNEGRCISMTTYDAYAEPAAPYSKQEYAYDPVVKNLVVSTLTSFYRDDEWQPMYGDRTVVTRNSDGNVTKMVEESLSYYGGGTTPEWNEETIIEIGYGADKKANRFVVSYSEDGEIEPEVELVDIVWYETNGQLVDLELDEYDFFLGPNRMKSARALGETTYPFVGDIYYNVEYKAGNAGFKMTATLNGETYAYTDYTALDDNGSYTCEEYEIDYDMMDDGTLERDDADLSVYSEVYDNCGLLLKRSDISYLDGDKANGISYSYEEIGTASYNPEYGYPLEYATASAYDEEELQNRERTVYSDYFDVIAAGIDNVETDDNAPVEYYNLQGVRVQNPENGMYIRRQGNKASKVFIR